MDLYHFAKGACTRAKNMNNEVMRVFLVFTAVSSCKHTRLESLLERGTFGSYSRTFFERGLHILKQGESVIKVRELFFARQRGGRGGGRSRRKSAGLQNQ